MQEKENNDIKQTMANEKLSHYYENIRSNVFSLLGETYSMYIQPATLAERVAYLLVCIFGKDQEEKNQNQVSLCTRHYMGATQKHLPLFSRVEDLAKM